MLCDNCRERDAAVHLTQIQEGQAVQRHLCQQCAAAGGVETTVGALPTRCERCNERDAVVHLTQIVESSAVQRHLCVECARAAGATVGIWPAGPHPMPRRDESADG